MAKKKEPDAYIVLENGEPLRKVATLEEGMRYVASRLSVGGDLPTFEVVPAEQVQ